MKCLSLVQQLGLMLAIMACGGSQDRTANPDAHAPAAASPVVAAAPPGIISTPMGDVWHQVFGSDNWVPAVEGTIMAKGDRLKTGDDGTVLLVFFEGSVMEAGGDSEVAIEEMGRPADSRSTTIRLRQITVLNPDSQGIASLAGIEHCMSLTNLSLKGNQIAHLSPLSELIGLVDLRLRGNEIEDIGPLAGLTNLTILDLNDCEISDIGPLSSLANLEGLGLAGNHISDISPLAGGLNLGHLELQDNEITDIFPLVVAALGAGTDCEGCYLNLTGNPLNAVSVNTCIPQLQELGIEVVF